MRFWELKKGAKEISDLAHLKIKILNIQIDEESCLIYNIQNIKDGI
jgi:hypothetical protein